MIFNFSYPATCLRDTYSGDKVLNISNHYDNIGQDKGQVLKEKNKRCLLKLSWVRKKVIHKKIYFNGNYFCLRLS